MLAVQQYLQTHDLNDLRQEYGIVTAEHPADPLVILNYGIESPKLHPIARECRGLTLEKGSWNVVARSFSRFFNWGEVPDEMKLFDWGNFVCQEKHDGSLIILYHYAGRWRCNTRGSFATDKMNYSPYTWEDLVWKSLPQPEGLDPQFCYVCELTSPYNKVVRSYAQTQLTLLTAFCLYPDEGDGFELPWPLYMPWLADCLGLPIPEVYSFNHLTEIETFLKEKEISDPTYEGVVIRDHMDRRWKLKNHAYLMTDGNAFNPKYILPFVLQNNEDELLAYFPEAKDTVAQIQYKVRCEYIALEEIWEAAKGIESQKDFALAIVPKTRFASILFQMRKKGTQLEDEWSAAEDLIFKILRPDFAKLGMDVEVRG